MEFEELMDDDKRLKKMSNESENLYGRPPKHVIFDDSLTNQSAVNMHYINGNDPHTYVIDSTRIPSPPFPLEKYEDNKCTNTCKNFIHVTWMLILLLYVLVVPVIMFQLNSKVQDINVIMYQLNSKVQDVNVIISQLNSDVQDVKAQVRETDDIQPVDGQTEQINITKSCMSKAPLTEEVPTVSTVYTRWGKTSCPNDTNVTLIYSGYVGGSCHTHEGGGTNYLCLPKQPSYGKYDEKDNDRGKIYGVEFELGESSIFDISAIDSPNAYCAVCKTNRRGVVLMIPATTTCPIGWTEEYHGYLMAQKYFMKRTEFICVDHQPDVKKETEKCENGGFLHFIETACNILPCGSKDQYIKNAELACVVCTK